MSITFTTTCSLSTIESAGFQLWCCDECVSPVYTSYEEAEAARAALPGFDVQAAALPGCELAEFYGDRYEGIPLIVPAAVDDRPAVEVSSTNGMLLLSLLGFLANSAPDRFMLDMLDTRGVAYSGDCDLTGEAAPQDMTGRILLAQALFGADMGVPTVTDGRFVAGGRRSGYLDHRLAELAELAQWAELHDRMVVWH